MERARISGDPSAIFWRIARVLLGVALVGTAVGWLETWWWAGEVAACFRPAFAAVLGLGALISWLRGSSGWALVCGLLSLSYPLQLLPGHRELKAAEAGGNGATLSVFCHNVKFTNRQGAAVLEEIRRRSPDLVILIELDSWWAKELEELEQTYPYNLVEARDGYFGMGIFSRKQLSESVIRDFSGYEMPSLLVRLEVEGQKVSVIGTHPPPPVSAFSYRVRNWHLAELAREARLRDEPLIVAGDFNCTPWSASLGRFLRHSGLRKSGVSREPTWSPWRLTWLGFPIDYQLASPHWKVVRSETGAFLGSDHRWTLVEYQLSDRR